jgi:hypothetical protein
MTYSWAWEEMTEEEREEALRDLDAWVRWLVDRYRVTELPTCWFRHTEVVPWVVALRAWHRAVWSPDAYDEDAVARSLWDWHVYGLVPFREQLRHLAPGCVGGRQHREPTLEEEGAWRRRLEQLRRGFEQALPRLVRDPGPMPPPREARSRPVERLRFVRTTNTDDCE